MHEGQGWGRADESHRVQGELAAYGAVPQWFALGDLDFGTHIVRSQWLGQGLSLSEVTARLAARWGLPEQRHHAAADERLPRRDPRRRRGRARGSARSTSRSGGCACRPRCPRSRFVAVGMDRATAAPGVLDAIRQADVVLLPPSNPVVSIGIILGVPGVRDALRGTALPSSVSRR